MIFFQEAFAFIISTCFELIFILFLLRLLFQLFQVNFYNPFSQFIFKYSNPILIPIQKVLPTLGRLDLATLFVLLSIKAAEFASLMLLATGQAPSMISLIIWPMGQLFSETFNIFFFAIILVAIMSWVNPRAHSPFTVILTQLTEPFLSPVRRRLRNVGIDFSPLFVLIGLKLLDLLLARPLTMLGKQLSIMT